MVIPSLPRTLALLDNPLLHVEAILVLDGVVINSNNTWLLTGPVAADCGGFEALLALKAFETCFRGGMVEGPATAAAFAVC